jgi:oxygen-independent coproporphyrinogen-3 oxidase
VFAKSPPQLPDEDIVFEMQQRIAERTGRAGYGNYEISAYAQPGQSCVHNLNYWMFGDYLGVGAGAHSKLTLADGIVRQERFSRPESYLNGAGERRFVSREHTVPAGELPFEFMLNALRLTQGVPAALFTERTGLPLGAIARPLAEAEARGLIQADPTSIRATPLGLRFLNDLQALFLPKHKALS